MGISSEDPCFCQPPHTGGRIGRLVHNNISSSALAAFILTSLWDCIVISYLTTINPSKPVFSCWASPCQDLALEFFTLVPGLTGSLFFFFLRQKDPCHFLESFPVDHMPTLPPYSRFSPSTWLGSFADAFLSQHWSLCCPLLSCFVQREVCEQGAHGHIPTDSLQGA